jgi:hypothetical protein
VTWEEKRAEVLAAIQATTDPLVLQMLLDEVYLFAETAALRPKK